jgi:GGDEF domain-containing protein
MYGGFESVLWGLGILLGLGLLGWLFLRERARSRRAGRLLEQYAQTFDGLLEASAPEHSHWPLKERLSSLHRLLRDSMGAQGLGLIFYDAFQERLEGLRIDSEARIVEVQYTGRETAMALLETLRSDKASGDLWDSVPPGPHRLTLPLQYGSDLLGILWVVFPTPDALRAAEKALRVLAHAFTLELKNRLLYEQAVRDSLTGLYTRAYLARRLHEEMSHYRRHQRPFSLIMLDLDHFKEINDTMGHLVGDRVLQMVAQAIRKVLREGDVPARYGGDEFLVLLPGAGHGGRPEGRPASAERPSGHHRFRYGSPSGKHPVYDERPGRFLPEPHPTASGAGSARGPGPPEGQADDPGRHLGGRVAEPTQLEGRDLARRMGLRTTSACRLPTTQGVHSREGRPPCAKAAML